MVQVSAGSILLCLTVKMVQLMVQFNPLIGSSFAGRNRVTFKRIGLYLECGLLAVIRNQESTLQFLGNHSKLLSIWQGLWTILSKVGNKQG